MRRAIDAVYRRDITGLQRTYGMACVGGIRRNPHRRRCTMPDPDNYYAWHCDINKVARRNLHLLELASVGGNRGSRGKLADCYRDDPRRLAGFVPDSDRVLVNKVAGRRLIINRDVGFAALCAAACCGYDDVVLAICCSG